MGPSPVLTSSNKDHLLFTLLGSCAGSTPDLQLAGCIAPSLASRHGPWQEIRETTSLGLHTVQFELPDQFLSTTAQEGSTHLEGHLMQFHSGMG